MQDDLAKSPLRRTISSSGLRVTLRYATASPGATWTAQNPQPLQVSVKVTNIRKPARKVYVTRATMRFTISDATGDVPGPDPLVDATNLTPGYLATSPFSYEQSFAVPALDDNARRLTVDLKLELVSLVDRNARDYTKQTVTDTVKVDLTG
ncbi:hypothetical protein [uncultured Friedmanniella sp.]|uniref:hypothetical protein n=1 Tax=uncultured Friedmanniella sp. TaxID=335381 RepID=UPI0035C9EDBD